MSKKNPFNEALPIYAICNVETVPLNPYREFVHFCQTTYYDKFAGKLGMSLKSFNDSRDTAVAKFKQVLSEDFSDLIFKEIEPSHPRIFFEFELFKEKVKICNVKFYTHLSYVTSSASSDEEEAAAEIDFTCSHDLDFLNGIKSEENLFDFNKTSTDDRTLDMILAHIRGLADFTEFIKHFKTKTLVVKNIEMFCEKLIKPWVVDISVLYTPEEFIIGTLCGDEINKESYSYDNYLESIKAYAQEIKDKYGDRYKIENEEVAAAPEN